ncbi:Bug family tripartite tricarboxylate transporter substrate binding protein [Thermodesulfobacteriota bacterium]
MRTASRFLLITMILFTFSITAYGGPETVYPERPVTILIPYAAGGPVDIATRTLIEAAKPYFPQSLIPLNKPGAGGAIATAALIGSAPDGYTLCATTESLLCVKPHMEPGLPYKGPGDVQPIIGVYAAPSGFFSRADAPWKTWKELLEYVKANPGKVRVGSAGTSTLIELEQVKRASKVDYIIVPFAGFSPTITNLLGGHTELGLMTIGPAVPHVKAGNLRALLVMHDKPLPAIDAPTMVEMGYETAPIPSRTVVVAPKGTPEQVVTILYNALRKGVETEYYRKYAAKNMIVFEDRDPGEWATFLQGRYTVLGKVIRELK